MACKCCSSFLYPPTICCESTQTFLYDLLYPLGPHDECAVADGKTTLHALGSLEARGSLFAGVGTEVYAGMIIGECARDNNMEVNPVREKKLTNVRASGADEKVALPFKLGCVVKLYSDGFTQECGLAVQACLPSVWQNRCYCNWIRQVLQT